MYFRELLYVRCEKLSHNSDPYVLSLFDNVRKTLVADISFTCCHFCRFLPTHFS